MRWDFVIVGSGFGGSVCALRLAEKGYRVLVLEKGRRLGPDDFPKTNWDLRRWLWMPALGWRGLYKMTFLPHLTALSGVGVGGGSLVYGNTLPLPKPEFFAASTWAHLASWQRELDPHYTEARRMLGAVQNPQLTAADEVMREVAGELGKPFEPTTVAVYFGKPGERAPDPYFGGEGPERSGCTRCGGCLLGCRHGAKNTLDQNYLFLAERRGVKVVADAEVTWVRPLDGGGYAVSTREGASVLGRRKGEHEAAQVIFAGGVLGTLPLLLALKASARGLPGLSARLGHFVRTNAEALIGVTTPRRDVDFSKGVAISSIVQTDEHSHVEPVRYSAGSGFYRLLVLPHVAGRNVLVRLARAAWAMLRRPLETLRCILVPDFARHSFILLYMRTVEGHLSLHRRRRWLTGFRKALTTDIAAGVAPQASMPEATEVAQRVAAKVDGMALSLVTEVLLDVPTTAHVLGGCCMGSTAEDGVIDHRHRLFGYDGLYVVDGSAVSANPGVNPSLTICALAERAMTFVPPKDA